MLFIVLFIGIPILLVFLIAKIIDDNNKKKQLQQWQNNIPAQNTIIQEQEQALPYRNKYLLTKNEWYFYKNLKPITDKYKLHPIAKIRLADIVEVNTSDKSKRQAHFNKIKSKHIDFALCNPENLKILLLIELDDNSHNTKQRVKRDEFVETVLNKCGYKLLRTRGTTDLENKILSLLPEYRQTNNHPN